MSSDAANDRAIIEWAASTPVAGHEAEWIRFVTEHLGLEAAYLPAVQEVLTQGRWRQADNSMGYVKTAAAREAARMGLADIENPFRQFPRFSDSRGRKISEEGVLDHLLYDAGPVKGKGGIWKATMPEDRSDYNREDERVTRRERLIDRAPARLQIKFKPSGELKKLLERLDMSTEAIPDIDWNKTFDEAGLDPGQRQVVNNMLIGLSRESALAEQESESQRKQLQAAYKRFYRTGMYKLRQVLARNSG